MPSFFILNSHAGYRIGLGEVSGRLQIRVMNLLNSRYQVVRAYPMPGRSFHISFSVDFNQQ
jgi:vitamin B12 transporter